MSDTNRVRLAFAKETSFGVQVTGANLKKLRLTGESLKQDSTIVPSEEMRDDRQIANIVRTSIEASGGINFELSHQSFDDLIAAALQSVNVYAQGLLTIDVLPTDGDTITFGTTVYRFKNTMIQANDIKIETADLPGTQANLVAVINGTGVAGTDYYAGSVTPHLLVRMATFATNASIITAKKAGLDGNAIATTETFAAGTNIFNAATLGTTTAGAGWSLTKTVTAITISVAASDDSFNDSGAGFTGISAYDWIYASGFTAATNNGWFKVLSASTTKIIVSNRSLLVDESSGTSRTIKKCPQITNGVQLTTFNIEKSFLDLTNIFSLYTGMAINTMSLDVPVDGIVTGSFEFMGTREQSKASSGGSGYEDAPTTIPMATVNDFDNLFEAEISISIMNFTLSLTNDLRSRLEAGTLGPASFGVGSIAVTGTLQVYLTSHALIDKYLNHVETSLAIALKDANGGGYVIDLPACRLTNGQRVAGGRNDDVIADCEWSAFMDGTEQKTIRIARLDA